jgi:uncharacterized protein involved in exopolysaccharide biosynthesis
VDKLGTTEVLHPASPGGDTPEHPTGTFARVKGMVSASLDSVLSASGLREEISERERAIRKLDARLSASAARRSSVVTVTCRAATPEAAQRLVATATEIFLKHYGSLTRTAGSHRFFAEQSNRLGESLAKASQLLRDRKNEYEIVDAEGARSILLQEISHVETAALDSDRELAQSVTHVEKLRETIAHLSTDVVMGTTTGANTGRDGMRQQLYELQKQEQDLIARMKPEHPEVVRVRQMRKEMERILDQQPEERAELTKAPNPIRVNLEGDLLRKQAECQALGKRKQVLVHQLNELKHKVHLLNDREVELAELQRNVTTLESRYQSHIDKLEQARIDEALQQESICSINVVQPATFVERPVSPAKRAGLVAGMLLAIIVSLSVAFGLELIDPTLRTQEQVESVLGLPVVADLPPERSATWRQRRLLRNGMGSSLLDSLEGSSRYQILVGTLCRLRTEHPADRQPSLAVALVNCGSSLRGSVAAQLALSATVLSDSPVLLVDADTTLRRAGDFFGANGNAGLSDVLKGKAELNECVRESGIANLSLLASGTPQSSKSIDLSHVRSRLQPLSDKYGLMIADLPTGDRHGTSILAAHDFDAVLLIVEAEHTRKDNALKIKKQLVELGANVLGCVLYGQLDYVPWWLRNFV